MATVYDVADYILAQCGAMSAMKLQKLVYYAQAWHLVWQEDALFPEQIEAWSHGPVVRELYDRHRGSFRLEGPMFGGDMSCLTPMQRSVIDKVLAFYGDKNPQWLSDLTHMEEPWRRAREGLADGERGNRVISQESMLEYYSSLP